MNLDFKFGISQTKPQEFEENEGHQKKIKKLLKLEESAEIINACKHYIQNFIPSPVENENIYWLITVFASNNYTPVRLTIYWHEVMNITEREEEVEGLGNYELMLFTDKEYFTDAIIKTLVNLIPGCRFDKDFQYSTGLVSQLAVFVPLESYFSLVANDNMFEAIRQYNHKLACKGRIVHKGHNFQFARLLFEK